MSRPLSPILEPELSGLIVLAAGVLLRVLLSIGFPIVAIDEPFMGRCWSFETSLRRRGNYRTARVAKTTSGNMTIFMAPRLPYFFA
jgi:hypothetical protein